MQVCDKEFVPPLSFRTDALAKIADQHADQADITPYWRQILAQNNLVAANRAGEIVAFMSFKNEFEQAEYFAGVAESGDVINYISTICVLPDYRRLHITSRFYDLMEEDLPPIAHGECVATRTWSANQSHIRLLNKRGYKLTYTIPNDRSTESGEKLDTIYFCKQVARSAAARYDLEKEKI
jgi:ribosomal protein S18 acetylase RimI-like enzyme